MPYKIEQEELSRISKFLNAEFAQLTLDKIKERLSWKLLAITDAFFYLIAKTTSFPPHRGGSSTGIGFFKILLTEQK